MQRRQAASRAPSDLSELAVERHEAEGTSSLQSEGVLRVHFHPGLPVPTVESMTDQLECLWPLSLVVTALVLTEEAVRFSGRLPVAQLAQIVSPAMQQLMEQRSLVDMPAAWEFGQGPQPDENRLLSEIIHSSGSSVRRSLTV